MASVQSESRTRRQWVINVGKAWVGTTPLTHSKNGNKTKLGLNEWRSEWMNELISTGKHRDALIQN